MPDAYLECEEVKKEMLRCRPQWALKNENVTEFRKLRYDWIRTKGGFWSKARSDTSDLAKKYQAQDVKILEMAREQSRDTREAVLYRGQVIVGEKALSDITGSWTTRSGVKIETDFWRVYLSLVWANMLSGNTAFRQWLGCSIDVDLLLTYFADEYEEFWTYEVQQSSVPRSWIRAAMFALQSERKTTNGTPTDAAIAVHLADVDSIISADKNFVAMANRCHEEAPFGLGRAFLIQAGNQGVEQLFEYIANTDGSA